MKRCILALILLIGFFPMLVCAEDDGNLRIDGDLGFTFSITSLYLSVNPRIMYDPGLFAIGGGVKSYFNLTYHDIYLMPYAMAEIGWFYLGGGIGFMVAEPDPATNEAGFVLPNTDDEGENEASGVLPFLTLGLAPSIIPLGPGKLGFNIGADLVFTATPVVIEDESESAANNILGSIFNTIFTFIFSSVKLNVSAVYSTWL